MKKNKHSILLDLFGVLIIVPVFIIGSTLLVTSVVIASQLSLLVLTYLGVL